MTTGAATINIRRYEPEDAEEVLSLHRRAIEEVGAYSDELSEYLDADMEDIEKNYLQNGGEFLVGRLDGRLVAMGAIKRISDNEAELKRMRVEPAFQRRGFGKTMLGKLEDRASELGISTLKLDTTVKQTGARLLYESSGYAFVETGRIGPFECLFYEKTLEELA